MTIDQESPDHDMTEVLGHSSHAYRKFNSILDPSIYEPLPDGWIIGMTDVVGSTEAIQDGRYQDVNFLGASIIANVGNALGSFDFPFSFAGDGATFALPAHHRDQAESALRQIADFSVKRFGLTMRAGLMTLRDIRQNDRDVRIARYAVSSDASYFMFSGGGIRWAERELKAGRFAVSPGVEPATEPDLTGLSCEWDSFESQRGTILSLLVEPSDMVNDITFSIVARSVMEVFEQADRQGSPVPARVPRRKVGRNNVDPRTWANIASNSDFRKFDDVLRLTVDCSLEEVAKVKAILREASDRGGTRFGWHCQSHAIMTCLVPGGSENAHLHFLDGLDGGYAKAAAMLRLNS
jgi:hypothetical protein